MKIKEVIKVLQEQDPELEVVLYCDHGQTLMKVSGWGAGYVEDLSQHMLEESEEEEGLSEVYVLEAL